MGKLHRFISGLQITASLLIVIAALVALWGWLKTRFGGKI
jgi:hypothetical protein